MYRWDKLSVYREVLARPLAATKMLARHRRTLAYLAGKGKWRNLYNLIFTTYFVRGEDCGKGVLDPVWKFFPWLTPYLWDIEMEITTRCYLRCSFCEHTYFPQDYINQDTPAQRVIDTVDSMPRLKWINLTGEGSPFLNREFMDMVRHVKNKGIYLDFSHDFYRLDESTMRELIELDVDRIYFSLEGVTKETYEAVRIGANFDEVVANVRRFIALKREYKSPLPELCFRMCFFNQNWREVEFLPDFIASLADGNVRDLGDEPSINIVGLLEFEQTRDWVVELSQDVINRTNERARRHGLTVYWSHPTHEEGRKPPLDYCVFWTEPYVMVTGHVVPCCAVLMSNRRPVLEKYAFGNISDSRTLKDIWDSKMYREFRRMVVDPHAKVPIQCAGCRTFNTKDRIHKYGIEDWGRG